MPTYNNIITKQYVIYQGTRIFFSVVFPPYLDVIYSHIQPEKLNIFEKKPPKEKTVSKV